MTIACRRVQLIKAAEFEKSIEMLKYQPAPNPVVSSGHTSVMVASGVPVNNMKADQGGQSSPANTDKQ